MDSPFALRFRILPHALCSSLPETACSVINSHLYLINCLKGRVFTRSEKGGAVKPLMDPNTPVFGYQAASLAKLQEVDGNLARAKHITLKPSGVGVK